MDIELSPQLARIHLSGRFDYSTHAEFLARVETLMAQAEQNELIVDMGQVDYIDSSALGMLLMMRDQARKVGRTVAIANLRGYVKQVVDNAQFGKLFDMR